MLSSFSIRLTLIRRLTSTSFKFNSVKTTTLINDEDKKVIRDESWKQNEPGLMEFFDQPDNWGEKIVRVGRPWKMEELRIKSNADLHKLWFVLYKEKNMLLTMQETHKSESRVFPSEERIEKVEESMENLEKIVKERNKAYFQLEVGEDSTAERSMAFRLDQFGRWRWQPMYEHYRPYRVSKNWRIVFGPNASKDVWTFLKQYRERRRNAEYAGLKSQHYIVRNLLRRFPNIDLDYLQRRHPRVPVQYIKDNLNFEPEYTRMISKGAYEELH